MSLINYENKVLIVDGFFYICHPPEEGRVGALTDVERISDWDALTFEELDRIYPDASGKLVVALDLGLTMSEILDYVSKDALQWENNAMQCLEDLKSITPGA